ncbi:hypothetical protein [Halocynthiibacter namhaensis]|uniref:hypothetical protein n=1 Tax=Halocynthiibacter namhaensis TaxID=1290553 RepID=UPI0012DFF3D2|nr:hypothetical protein [Halocynthiibacter namhaensis]
MQFDVDWENPIESQLGPNGAVVRYLNATGVKPGDGLLQIYAAINAGDAGRYDVSDEFAGGAPGTVRDKVAQMTSSGHRRNAERIIQYAQRCGCYTRSSDAPTIILGAQDRNPCLRKAGFMAFDVYNTPPEHFPEAIREEYKEIDTHWDRVWDMGLSATGSTPDAKQDSNAENTDRTWEEATTLDVDVVTQDSGMFCRFYAPKEKHDAQGNPTCPPVLSFRGSEPNKEEFRSLAMGLHIRAEYYLRKNDHLGGAAGETILNRFTLFFPMYLGEDWEKHVTGEIDPQAKSEEVTPPEDVTTWLDALRDTPGVLGDAIRLGEGVLNVGEAIVEGVQDFARITDVEWLPDGEGMPQEFQDQLDELNLGNAKTVLNSPGDMAVDAPSINALLNTLSGAELRVRYFARATLHYDEMGDWGANVTQSLGRIGAQYEGVIKAVDRAVETAKYFGNRLNIVGHSLGGGLAQAASLYCHKEHPDIKLGSRHFNAAGLHAITARDIAKATRADGLNIPVEAKQVSGELLSTAQTPGAMPFVWDVLRWGQNTVLPNAVGIYDNRQGISPGPFPIESDADHQQHFDTPLPPYPNITGGPPPDVPDGQLLPHLFPLQKQTRFMSPNYKIGTRQLGTQGNLRNTGSGTRPVGLVHPAFTNSALEDVATGGAPEEQSIADLTMPTFKHVEPVQIESPHISALSGMANRAVDFNTFVKEAVNYLMEVASQKIEDRESWVDYVVPAKNLYDIYAGLSELSGELSEEGVRLLELFKLSAHYHPGDIASSTFLRPPEEDQ